MGAMEAVVAVNRKRRRHEQKQVVDSRRGGSLQENVRTAAKPQPQPGISRPTRSATVFGPIEILLLTYLGLILLFYRSGLLLKMSKPPGGLV